MRYAPTIFRQMNGIASKPNRATENPVRAKSDAAKIDGLRGEAPTDPPRIVPNRSESARFTRFAPPEDVDESGRHRKSPYPTERKRTWPRKNC